LFHICPSALIQWMFSIVYVPGHLRREFLQLRPRIVNSASRGRLRAGNRSACAKAT
jgi:hypothetical protein